jgi:mono/diheme cytochrome c family protein
MKDALRLRVLLALAFVVAIAVGAAPRSAPSSNGPDDGGSIERGRYLTHEVAMCVQCHSPRDSKGRIIESQEFRGAPMPIISPYPGAPFAFTAPNLRELARSSGESIVRLLRTGIGRDGKSPQLPMPPFRMNAEDARSIVLYLQSLD